MSLKKKSTNIYAPPDNFVYMTIKSFTWGLIGLILGVFINNSIVYLSGNLKIESLIIQNILQVLSCAIILSLLNKYFHFFGWSWQNHTEGLFFVSFFFGVQYKILSNIQNDYVVRDTINDTIGKLIYTKTTTTQKL